MMISIMAYALLIACLLAMSALVTERIFAELRWPRRWIWLITLAASLVLPAYSILADQRAAEPVIVAAQILTNSPSDASSIEPRTSVPAANQVPQLSWPDGNDWEKFNRPLAVLWVASSSGIMLVYGLAWLSLNRSRRRWRSVRIAGQEVLISERLGPAVFGFVKAHIILPRWLLDAQPMMRSMVLRHENEHIAARDQLLLLLALILLAVAPWNVPLWWHFRRLRLAIEVDCDARVMRHGTDAATYSEALLAVRQRRSITPFAAIALSEPASYLERRIQLVMRTTSRVSGSLVTLGTLVAAALLVAACAVDPPQLDVPTTADSIIESSNVRRQPVTGLLLGGERVIILVDVSSSMLGRTLVDINQRRNMPVEQQRQAPKWRQLVDTVDWLTAQIQPGSRFQVVAFNDDAYSLIAGTDGQWLTATDGSLLAQAVQTLRNEVLPDGPTSLHVAFNAVSALQPKADNIYLLVDGLPTMGEASASGTSLTGQERMSHLDGAIDELPIGTPVNIVLMPLEGDPMSAPAYWTLALRTGGSLFAPAEDWP